MRYIEKNFSYENTDVIAYETELIENKLDKCNLSDAAIHPTMSGPDVYDVVKSFDSFKKLKQAMLRDQGFICCYCGQLIKESTHIGSKYIDATYIVEHVLPKTKYRHLAGEYENLLLSCKPTQEEENERKQAGGNKKNNIKYWHCDKLKDNKELNYTPLQKDCASHFIYLDNGEVEGNDMLANTDIKTLGLNCNYLKNRRYNAILGAIFDEDNTLISNEEMEQYATLVMKRKQDGSFVEFCFVIAGAINHLLNK